MNKIIWLNLNVFPFVQVQMHKHSQVINQTIRNPPVKSIRIINNVNRGTLVVVESPYIVVELDVDEYNPFA